MRTALAQRRHALLARELFGRLGHVFEVRSNGSAETQPTYAFRTVDVLLCGRLGLFERLGWRERDAVVVPWDAVLEVGEREIVVRGSKDDYRRI